MAKPPPMHPIVLRSMGLSMFVLGLGLLGFSAWLFLRGANGAGAVITGLAVVAGGMALQAKARMLEK